MCIPCAAPAFPVLGTILLILIVLIGGLLTGAARALPVIGVIIAWATTMTYRFVSGAVMTKGWRDKDVDHWDSVRAKTGRGPRLTRPLRAFVRMSLVAVTIGLLTDWAVTFYVLGSVTAVTGGAVGYARRARIERAARLAIGRDTDTVIRAKAEVRR